MAITITSESIGSMRVALQNLESAMDAMRPQALRTAQHADHFEKLASIITDARIEAKSLEDALFETGYSESGTAIHEKALLYPQLSERERQVAELIASEGLSNLQIGNRLDLREQSIKNIVGSLMKKIGAENRTQIANRMRLGK